MLNTAILYDFLYDFNDNLKMNYEVYKAISDSIYHHKIINCIVLSIVLNYSILHYKTFDEFCANLQHIHKTRTEKYVVQHFILIVLYDKLHMQYLLKVTGFTVK